MKVLSKIIAVVALRIFKTEWLALRVRLASVYQLHLSDPVGSPSVFAQRLLISGEDHRFFSHGGIDPVAILRAAWRSVVLRRREGGSTIEMQVVRVTTERYERTLMRKVREMALATLVTREIPKSVLPAIYLRIGYYGWQMSSFGMACKHLRLSPDSLSPLEAAKLVARLKYPQPHHLLPHRQRQIDVRATHLMQLYRHHQNGYTYIGLTLETHYAAV